MKQKTILSIITAAVLLLSLSSCGKQEEPAEPTPTPEAARSVTYSGTLRAAREAKVYSDATGEIIECHAEEGDFVQAGAVLYRIDDNGLYDNIKTAENALQKSQISLNTAQKNQNDLKIYAPANGILKDFNIKAGERVNTQTIGQIIDESRLVAKVPFSEQQLSSISVGSAGKLISADLMSETPVNVTRIYAERNTSVPGAVLYDVELTGANKGGLYNGMSVTAEINGMSSPASGTIINADSVALVSKASGNARAVYAKEGDYVQKGALLIEIENANVSSSLQRAQLDKNDYEIKLNALRSDADNLSVRAPISGQVTEKTKGLRDSIGSKSDSIMTIADTSTLLLDVTVAEEDFTALMQGQQIAVDCGSYGVLDGTVASLNDSIFGVTVEIANGLGIPANTAAQITFTKGA